MFRVIRFCPVIRVLYTKSFCNPHFYWMLDIGYSMLFWVIRCCPVIRVLLYEDLNFRQQRPRFVGLELGQVNLNLAEGEDLGEGADDGLSDLHLGPVGAGQFGVQFVDEAVAPHLVKNGFDERDEERLLAAVLPGVEPDSTAGAIIEAFILAWGDLAWVEEVRAFAPGSTQLLLYGAHQRGLAGAPFAVDADGEGSAGALGGDDPGEGLGVLLELKVSPLAPFFSTGSSVTIQGVINSMGFSSTTLHLPGNNDIWG